jgi:hypothetical protein
MTGRTREVVLAAKDDTKVFRLPDGSRSVDSVWVWRGFLFMSLIAGGLCITFATGGMVFYAASWGIITVGWFAISMWLWRKHVLADDARWRARKEGGHAA